MPESRQKLYQKQELLEETIKEIKEKATQSELRLVVVQTYIQEVEQKWKEFQETHKIIMARGPKDHDYFKNDYYGQTEKSVAETLNILMVKKEAEAKGSGDEKGSLK